MRNSAAVDLPGLLAADEPRACEVEGVAGRSALVFICDHAGMRIPRCLESLGLPPEQLQRHIGWDIGAAAVSRSLGEVLDATVILQPYSRLVIDCNRPLRTSESIVTRSEDTLIPGNHGLSHSEVTRRERDIFLPYHACIGETLDARRRGGQPTLLVAVHSFTPVYCGEPRPWHIGVLYNRDDRMARALACALRAEPGLVVGDNEPYSVSDDTDYSIPEYGERRGLLHVGIEIRQDLIADSPGQRRWAHRLAHMLVPLSASLLST